MLGTLVRGEDGSVVTFTPSRRWKFGTRYRYGVSQAVRALSGATLAQSFNGEFTTFAPRVIGNVALPDVRDVAVAGPVAVAATSSGLAVLDLAQPGAPSVVAQLAVPGGANAIAIVSGGVTDRAGQTVPGRVVVAATGDGITAGALRSYSISDPASPALLGSTQLTTASGQAPPAGVPGPGTPVGVAIGEGGRAFVATRNVGVQSVDVGQAIPLDAGTLTRGLGPRHPSPGLQDLVHVASFGDRIVTGGATGLTVLDPPALTAVGEAPGVPVSALDAIAGSITRNVPGFGMDVDGDGRIDPGAEVFDLAVAGTGDGVIQFLRSTDGGAPTLFSVVRLAGAVTGVDLDRDGDLAFVSLGPRGVAIVDLAGPASIQPIDLDRDGTDDRLLGLVDTPGTARGAAVAAARGLAVVADGSPGVAVLQVGPGRTAFTGLERDPVAALPGDERSILETREAFATDDAVRVTVEAVSPEGSPVTVSLVARDASGTTSGLVTFADGSTAVTVPQGSSVLAIDLGGPGSAGLEVTVAARNAAGQRLTETTFRVVAAPDITSAAPTRLIVAPASLELSVTARRGRLGVLAEFADGQIVNVTTDPATAFRSEQPLVAQVGPGGEVIGGAGGTTIVVATYRGVEGGTVVSVRAPAQLSALETRRPRLTLRSTDTTLPLPVLAALTDGSTGTAADVGLTFSSSDTAVVTVDGSGGLRAVGNGQATVTARRGAVSLEFQVSVELRLPTALAGIALDAVASPPRSEGGRFTVGARLSGSGSLDGLAVTFQAGGRTATATSDLDGVARVELAGVTAGATTLIATVTDPATATPLSASVPLAIVAAGVDAEPNDTAQNATPLSLGPPVSGRLGAGDVRDAYRVETAVSGSLTATLTLGASTQPADVRVVFLRADGSVLSSVTATSRSFRASQPVADGAVVVAVETTGRAVDYTLATRIDQGPMTVAGIAPTAGAPGTEVQISGSGFPNDLAQVRVLFGGVGARVLSATPTALRVVVPASAVNGPVTVIGRQRRAVGPAFDPGSPSPLPPVALARQAAPEVRFDPAAGVAVDVRLLSVDAQPDATPAQLQQLAASVGARLAGRVPATNTYFFELPVNASLATLATVRRQALASPLVRRAVRNVQFELRNGPIDGRDNPWVWLGRSVSASAALNQIRLFDAFDAIRDHPDFLAATQLRTAKVAIIDTGFDPRGNPAEFTFNGASVVTLLTPNAAGVFAAATAFADADGHGTLVTSIVAALNHGSGASGVLNGVLQRGETPFDVTVYSKTPAAASTVTGWDLAQTALADVASRGDIDAVNLSFGYSFETPTQEYVDLRAAFEDAFALLAGRTVVTVAAGNDGVRAEYDVPSTPAGYLDHVISVGATAVANSDLTGEASDARAIFGGPSPEGFPTCGSGLALTGSNCNSNVTLAAPGEDILVIGRPSRPFVPFYDPPTRGTSFAAPIVAGLAALIQTIRPTSAPLTPDFIRSLLVDTSDDITGRWDDGPMRRVNALTAVSSLLRPLQPQMTYVADQDAVGASGAVGRIVAIDVDPLTGQRRLTSPVDTEIPLMLTQGAATLEARRPTSLAISPAGDLFAAVVETVSPAMGHGVMLFGTRSQRATGFVAFSGASFPDAVGAGTPVGPGTLRPGLVFSRDGRLLYVGVGSRILVINTVAGRLVRTFDDLPAPYKPLVGSTLNPPLAARLASVQALIAQGVPSSTGARSGQSVTGLALSPDGRVLYAAVHTGGGSGQQPGGVLAIDVALYDDADASLRGLQATLTNYFTPLSGPPVPLVGPGSFSGGDEPGAVAVSPDGKHVYLVNGGLNFFQTIPPDDLDLSKYFMLFGGPALSTLSFGGGSLSALANAQSFVQNTANGLYQELLLDMQLQAKSGLTMVGAPGFTGVFAPASRPTALPGQPEPAPVAPAVSWQFPNDVSFAWAPNPANGGRVANQSRFQNVFAKRPFDMAIRPDGRRALVPMFQTGNFGVLDLDAQPQLSQPMSGRPSPNPNLQGLPPTAFTAFVAMTEAIRLDNHVWPSRGAFVSAADNVSFVPGPDENLLFAWRIEYAQNGRFAVATHVGSGAPRSVSGVVGDFTRDAQLRFALQGLGYAFNAAAGVLQAIDGTTTPQTIAPFDTVTFERGGGAVSFIDDRAISVDLQQNLARTTVGETGTERPYYATYPVCRTPNPGAPRCIESPVRSLRAYNAPGGAAGRFHRPRGVAIQPFVYFELPRFGDHVTKTTALSVGWRDDRIVTVTVQVADLGQLDENGAAAVIGTLPVTLSNAQMDAGFYTVGFGSLFPQATPPVQGGRYRVTALVSTTSEELSRTAIDVTYNDDGAVTSDLSLDLSPNTMFVQPPDQNGTPRQLRVVLRQQGQSTDITNDPDLRFRWILGEAGVPNCPVLVPGPLCPRWHDGSGGADAKLLEEVNALLELLRTGLKWYDQSIPFELATLEVSSDRKLRALSAGVNIVQACRGDCDNGLRSDPAIVLSGLTLEELTLEPYSVITSAGDALVETPVNSLLEKLQDETTFGKVLKVADVELGINTPLILTADTTQCIGTDFIFDKGAVLVDDVKFGFLGKGELALSDIGAFFDKVREKFRIPAPPQVRYGLKVLEKILDVNLTQFIVFEYRGRLRRGRVPDRRPGAGRRAGVRAGRHPGRHDNYGHARPHLAGPRRGRRQRPGDRAARPGGSEVRTAEGRVPRVRERAAGPEDPHVRDNDAHHAGTARVDATGHQPGSRGMGEGDVPQRLVELLWHEGLRGAGRLPIRDLRVRDHGARSGEGQRQSRADRLPHPAGDDLRAGDRERVPRGWTAQRGRDREGHAGAWRHLRRSRHAQGDTGQHDDHQRRDVPVRRAGPGDWTRGSAGLRASSAASTSPPTAAPAAAAPVTWPTPRHGAEDGAVPGGSR